MALFVLVIGVSACEGFLEGINENPNSPTDVSVTVILPAAQVTIADVTGGDFSRFASVLVQHTEGVARQWTSINNYSSMNPASFNTAWNNTYENILVELMTIKSKASEAGYAHYEGVTNVLIAYTLMMATDVWDDMPYTEAFQGTDVISPVFDTQASIYTEIFNLLSSAETLLAGSAGDLAPGNEDVYYGGDIAMWRLAINALEARAHLHLGNYSDALSNATSSFTSAADNMAYNYPDASNAGQWYRFNRDRTGDIEFHPTIRGIMTGLNDTDRLGVLDNTFVTGHPYFVPDFAQELISYREVKFIEAECLLRTGGSAAAIRDAYLEGINASFDHVGADGYAAYVAQASVDPGAGNIDLEDIMTQKYIGLFTQPEVYSDWRRTGIPSLTANSGASIPVRFPYGSDEILFNQNAPEENDVNIFSDRVGWNR